ncbi:golgi apparatus membrane protein tvp38 [Moniliophthora roreri MCA 2997]|uniref:Golgi apparatus membrane protein TVP38 n=1 Tax=Moniliophthora roreri (strain MCA 2997) TaxID=1381753 RepID=V2XXT1_MONRO|nr:golgi apparatus membrane protein tvp38 [Moniliophthora roreri MCA 2997]
MAAAAAAGKASNLWSSFKYYLSATFRRYQRLHVYGKVFIWLALLFYICIGVFVVIVSPSRIAQFLYDQATKLAETPVGWLILGFAIVIISFPPLIGHTTLVTLCGFAYGMKGFAIASTASVVGSALVFAVLRMLFSARLRAWSAQNEKWQALEAVVRAKGLPLIILIRISPFPPWVYANSLFASISSVSLWQFVVATLFIFPKLLLHVFIGSRMAALSDGERRSHMDTRTKVINGLLIGGGVLVAICASGLVYTLVQRHIRTLDGLPRDVDEHAADAIEHFDEEAPLLGPQPLSEDDDDTN